MTFSTNPLFQSLFYAFSFRFVLSVKDSTNAINSEDRKTPCSNPTFVLGLAAGTNLVTGLPVTFRRSNRIKRNKINIGETDCLLVVTEKWPKSSQIVAQKRIRRGQRKLDRNTLNIRLTYNRTPMTDFSLITCAL